MRALCWNGVNDLRVERVPDPRILGPQDAIIKVGLSSVCGSDLHLIGGHVPTMRAGDIIGHEFLGEVVEKGPEVTRLNRGDRVITVSIIGCGKCWHCQQEEFSLCDNSNPQPAFEESAYGHCTAGIFGYSHAFGGYAGSHAEYIRVPFADTNCFRVPEGVTDEQAVFVSDAVPTGYMAADMGNIKPGDVVAVWGCGGVGQMAMKSAFLLGAERVIGIDRFPDRLRAAQMKAGAETLDYSRVDIYDALLAMTGGRGPDVCIDAVGMEADSGGPANRGLAIEDLYDRSKQALRLESDRPAVLRQMIQCCRKGGTLSIVGVYGGLIDKFPMGAAMNKALTLRMGQQHGQRYVKRLFAHIEKGDLDPSYLLTHKWALDDAPQGYRMFKDKADDCMRVVFTP
ncbi:glutathione-dependent formaldehyde dehydrogenase [Azospirillum sp. TSH58]|uniref:zinc-dependent alcohol dehydrogenase n=1 Tax=Azospirillum sp. TSH58 TaxID=664962 RepID=UPI000D602131|nr:zinc-dependent alcohol dehydrogenase [Azospirillum sp. TSH58]AWJ84634.1 glutathione-dependent formaldehyde dehydrogenase [Azospirillum sp. TSH58]PWC70215.1 alcohol dehydrogenase [Azospirillum sp. TSH58]